MKTFLMAGLSALLLPAAGVSAVPVLQRFEAIGEGLVSSDISVHQAGLEHAATFGPWTLELGGTHTSYRLGYASTLLGTSRLLEQDTSQIGLALSHAWENHASAMLNLTGYEGFADFRSLWISEHYRELFGAFANDYHSPDPRGRSLGLSGTWHYQPGAGLAEAGLSFGRDTIASGWEFNPLAGRPEPASDTLDTVTGNLRFEQALNGWLKTGATLSLRDTTSREPRWSLRHSWAAAQGPWALRLAGGLSGERPDFQASHAEAVIEWNFLPGWHATLGQRLYRDSGEIENSSFSTAAPELRSRETSLGLLWERGALSLSAAAGLLHADYGTLSPATNFFGQLYRDRTWTTFRLAAAYEF